MTAPQPPKILLDTNLFLFIFLDVEGLKIKEPAERARALIGSKLCSKVFSDPSIIKVVPDFIVDVEYPRALTRLIVREGITNPIKLRILANIYKNLRKALESHIKLGYCHLASIWDNPQIFKRAAGLWKRLQRKRRHQDLIILATAEHHKATLITADTKIKETIAAANINVEAYIIEIDEAIGKASLIGKPKTPIPSIEDAINQAIKKLEKER